MISFTIISLATDRTADSQRGKLRFNLRYVDRPVRFDLLFRPCYLRSLCDREHAFCYPFIDAGAACAVWAWLISGAECMCLAVWNWCQHLPQGGLYYTSPQTIPPSWVAAIDWVARWLNLLGQVEGTAPSAPGSAQLLLAAVSIGFYHQHPCLFNGCSEETLWRRQSSSDVWNREDNEDLCVVPFRGTPCLCHCATGCYQSQTVTVTRMHPL